MNAGKAYIYHLTLSNNLKKSELFCVLGKIKLQENSGKLAQIIVLTKNSRTCDVLTNCLNFCGTSASSIHENLSEVENEKSVVLFSDRKVSVLVTNKTSIDLPAKSFKHVINYDMFVPNLLHSDDASLECSSNEELVYC